MPSAYIASTGAPEGWSAPAAAGQGQFSFALMNTPTPRPAERANRPAERANIPRLLAGAGLRPTRQRVSLATLLFGSGDRHVNAEMLHAEAVGSGVRVSLATVYNTLHQFVRAGLLREIAIGGQRAYFDTNTSNHNHFFV